MPKIYLALSRSFHTGAFVGRDDVFDATLRRAGLLRVYELDALFDAVEKLRKVREKMPK
jgi:acetyltransferase